MSLTGVTHIGAIIRDQDKALAWYQDVLGAEVAGDNVFEWEGMKIRWLTVRIPGDNVEINLLPPMPSPDGTLPAVGDAKMVVLGTNNCQAVYDLVKDKVSDISSQRNSPGVRVWFFATLMETHTILSKPPPWCNPLSRMDAGVKKWTQKRNYKNAWGTHLLSVLPS